MNASTAYRQLEARESNPVHLVVLLYDQLIRDLRAAAEACDRTDIPARTNEIDHALAVLGQLQATLNMQQGQEVASNLKRFYDVLRAHLLTAQIQASGDMLRGQIPAVIEVRDAWAEVERQQRPAAHVSQGDVMGDPVANDSPFPSPGGWRA
jgi:flagellar protein FliS